MPTRPSTGCHQCQFHSRTAQYIFFPPNWPMGLTETSIQEAPRGLNWPLHETHQSPPPSAEVMNKWSSTSMPPYDFTVYTGTLPFLHVCATSPNCYAAQRLTTVMHSYFNTRVSNPRTVTLCNAAGAHICKLYTCINTITKTTR